VDNRERQIAGTISGATGPAAPAPDQTNGGGGGGGGGKGSGGPTVTCTLCGKVGHPKKECWQNPKVIAAKAAGKGGSTTPPFPKQRGKSPKGKGRGRGAAAGSGAAGTGPPPDKSNMVCWGYNRGTCGGKVCPKGLAHRKWTKEEEARAAQTIRTASPAAAKAAAP